MTNISRLQPTKNTGTSTSTDDGDPLRNKLAAAIKDAEKIRHQAARQRAGLERTGDALIMAEAALEKAKAAVTKAQQSHIDALAHHSAMGTEPPPSKVKAARQAVVDCQDEADAQRETYAKLKSDLPLWATEISLAETEVDAAISAILAIEAEKLIERGREIASQFAPIRQALNALWSEPTPAGHDASLAFELARRPLDETKIAIADFLRSTTAIKRVEPVWIEARKRLRENPHTTLPEIDGLLNG